MVRQLNKEILDKVSEIVEYIKNTPDYKGYLKTKELLDKDIKLKELIEKIKKTQKLLVKTKDLKLEEELDKLTQELNSNPLYLEYSNYLSEVNNMLAIFENKINKYFNDVFN